MGIKFKGNPKKLRSSSTNLEIMLLVSRFNAVQLYDDRSCLVMLGLATGGTGK